MACELLIIRGAIQKNPWRSGHVIAVKDCPCEWGSKETLPNWVKIRIIDATADQVKNYLGEWPTGVFVFSIVAQNAQGYRIRIAADPDIISATGLNRAIKERVRSEILAIAPGATIVNYDDNSATIDIPKPADLNRMKKELQAELKSRFEARRYYFAAADVELVADAGGFMELTAAQVLARIKDRLAE